MLPWMIWNGTDSRQMGLVISTPPRMYPAERVESITVPGRPGSLLRPEGVGIYDPYTLSIQAANRRTVNPSALLAWLRGSGELVLSTEPDRIYSARIINGGQLNCLFSGVYQGDVQFLCQPLRGQYPPEPAVSVTPSVSVTSMTLYNPGDVPARCLYTATGTDDVILSLDGAPAFEIVFPESPGGTVLVDTDAGQALLDGEPPENYANHVSGSYRGLWIPTGSHTLTWSGEGTLAALTVLPRWRWI